jgi:hypothetical protein
VQGLLIYNSQTFKMEKKKTDKPEAYPKPSTEDNQYRNQPEFTEVQPNEFEDQRVSDKPSLKDDDKKKEEN